MIFLWPRRLPSPCVFALVRHLWIPLCAATPRITYSDFESLSSMTLSSMTALLFFVPARVSSCVVRSASLRIYSLSAEVDVFRSFLQYCALDISAVAGLPCVLSLTLAVISATLHSHPLCFCSRLLVEFFSVVAAYLTLPGAHVMYSPCSCTLRLSPRSSL